MAKAVRQLERLAVEAVTACEAAEAPQVWLLAFEKLAALGSSSKKLIQALLRQLTGMRQGPVRVRLHLPQAASVYDSHCNTRHKPLPLSYACTATPARHQHFGRG